MTNHPPTPCCNYVGLGTMPHPVCWNPYNEVVQCHNCGHVYEPVDRKQELATHLLLKQAWYALRDAFNRMSTIRETNPEIYLTEDMRHILRCIPHTRANYTDDDVNLACERMHRATKCDWCDSKLVPALGPKGDVYFMCPTPEKHVTSGTL